MIIEGEMIPSPAIGPNTAFIRGFVVSTTGPWGNQKGDDDRGGGEDSGGHQKNYDGQM
jgi:hypothetical protein